VQTVTEGDMLANFFGSVADPGMSYMSVNILGSRTAADQRIGCFAP